MSIFIRIWFFFGLIILLGLWFMSYTFNQQVKPNVRQVVEDTLAENANIIAMLVAEDVYENKVNTVQFDAKIQNALNRKLNANIWQHNKKEINQQIFNFKEEKNNLYLSQKNEIENAAAPNQLLMRIEAAANGADKGIGNKARN